MKGRVEKGSLVHDVNSTLAAILSSLELVKDEWKANPQLVDKLIPLTKEKLNVLEALLKEYQKEN